MEDGERDVPAGDAKAAVAARIGARTAPDPADGSLGNGNAAGAGGEAGRRYRVRYEGTVSEAWVVQEPREALVRLCSRWGRDFSDCLDLTIETTKGGVLVAKAEFDIRAEEEVRAGSAHEAALGFVARRGLRAFEPEGLSVADLDAPEPAKPVAPAMAATLHIKRTFLRLASDEEALEHGFEDLDEGEGVAVFDIGCGSPMYSRVRLAPEATPA